MPLHTSFRIPLILALMFVLSNQSLAFATSSEANAGSAVWPEGSTDPAYTIQVDTMSFRVDYPFKKWAIDPEFQENAQVLDSMRRFKASALANPLQDVRLLLLASSSSPEGPVAYNNDLTRKRLESLHRLIVDEMDWKIDSVVVRSISPEQIALFSKAQKGGDGKLALYRQLRFAEADFVVTTKIPVPQPEPVLIEIEEGVKETLPEPETEPEPVPVPAPVPMPMPEETFDETFGYVRVKTNGLGWLMLVPNIALEVDLDERWSVNLPIYYSALNYFTSTLKFRTLCFQPEARYWFGDDHRGWYLGAHLGVGFFNYAVGDYRIQDHRGKTPAFGGGLAAGWRFNLTTSGRWQMELSAGLGAYYARYDKFDNSRNGAYVASNVKHTFLGIDQAAVTLSYRFGSTYHHKNKASR